jgi:hypothetical protein
MVQAIKLVHFIFGHKFSTARGIHSRADCNSFVVRQPVHSGATRFDFASDSSEFLLILFRPGLHLL